MPRFVHFTPSTRIRPVYLIPLPLKLEVPELWTSRETYKLPITKLTPGRSDRVRLPIDHFGEYRLSSFAHDIRRKVFTPKPEGEVVLLIDPVVKTHPVVLSDLHGHGYARDEVARYYHNSS